MQFLQAVEPGASWYVPAAQLSHSASREVIDKYGQIRGTVTCNGDAKRLEKNDLIISLEPDCQQALLTHENCKP